MYSTLGSSQQQFLSPPPYQFSQPTTPINVPSPLNPSFDYDSSMGMSTSYSPVMTYSPALEYEPHFPNQAYVNRNLPVINTSFPAMGVSPAHLTASSGTPSTFNTPIHGLRQFSPFTSSPTSPLPPLNVSCSLLPSLFYKAPAR